LETKSDIDRKKKIFFRKQSVLNASEFCNAQLLGKLELPGGERVWHKSRLCWAYRRTQAQKSQPVDKINKENRWVRKIRKGLRFGDVRMRQWEVEKIGLSLISLSKMELRKSELGYRIVKVARIKMHCTK